MKKILLTALLIACALPAFTITPKKALQEPQRPDIVFNRAPLAAQYRDQALIFNTRSWMKPTTRCSTLPSTTTFSPAARRGTS